MPRKKKSETKKDDKNKALDTALAGVKKKFGDIVVGWASSLPNTDKTIIPTGSLSLDSALGIGGVLLGRAYEFYGKPSGGKSTLAYSIMVNAMNRDHKCLLVDAEHAFDPQLLVDMGGDLSKLALVKGYTGEEQLDAASAIMGTGDVDICVIDSVAALVPTAETQQDSYADQTIGLHARLMSKMCRNMIPLAGRTKTALIFINQIRANIDRYGGSRTTTGGNSIPFYCSVRVEVRPGSKNERVMDDGGIPLGQKTHFSIAKNKLAPPYREASVNLMYGKGFDINSELVDLSLDLGIAEQAGAWFKYGGEKFQGRHNFIKHLEENEKAREDLLSKVVPVLGLDLKNYENISNE